MNETHTTSGLVKDPSVAPGGYSTYRPRLQWAWWTRNQHYTIYMLRELSSVFIALWSVRFLAQLNRLRRGDAAAYERSVEAQRNPGWIVFDVVTLLFALLHAVTWFQLTGVVMSGMARKVRLGSFRLSGREIAAGSFASWAAASLGVLVALLMAGRDSEDE